MSVITLFLLMMVVISWLFNPESMRSKVVMMTMGSGTTVHLYLHSSIMTCKVKISSNIHLNINNSLFILFMPIVFIILSFHPNFKVFLCLCCVIRPCGSGNSVAMTSIDITCPSVHIQFLLQK